MRAGATRSTNTSPSRERSPRSRAPERPRVERAPVPGRIGFRRPPPTPMGACKRSPSTVLPDSRVVHSVGRAGVVEGMRATDHSHEGLFLVCEATSGRLALVRRTSLHPRLRWPRPLGRTSANFYGARFSSRASAASFCRLPRPTLARRVLLKFVLEREDHLLVIRMLRVARTVRHRTLSTSGCSCGQAGV